MILVLLGVLIVVGFYYYCIKPLSYWKNKGVPQTEPVWFFGDSLRSFGKDKVIEFLEYLYYGPGDGRYAGHYNFTYPVLNIKDPELAKKVLVKDFDHFVDHYVFQASESDPLWSNLLITLKGVTGMCMLLRRLAYPNRLRELDLFGYSPQSMSLLINKMLQIMEPKCFHLIADLRRLHWLNQNKLQLYSQAVRNKGAAIPNCWGFIDGTTRAICRPTLDQENYYSGHKRFHCVKYQSVLCPDGIIVSLKGAWPGRRHDAAIFAQSGIYTELERIAKFPNGQKYVLFGDQGYGISELLYTPFTNRGNKWREMRSILTPCFTSSKMRAMFPLMTGCAERFTKYFLSLNEQVVSVEMKDNFTRYATDVIASTAFGVEVDSLEQPENIFYVMGKRATTFDFWKIVRFFISILLPKLNALLGLMILDKETLDFFVNLVDQTIKTREEKGIVRPDMIHLLMEARKGKIKNEEGGKDESSTHITGGVHDKTLNSITNIDIAAQAMIFFFGGFETSSNLMNFMAYELAENKNVQDRLRKEIENTLNECNGKLTYEALLKMKYMDMVISEALRKWPVNLVVDRECTKPYTIEPVLPEEKPVHLDKGSYICAMIYCFHRDPRYFPNPDVFDPERFSAENVDKIQPYTYFPFGVGPRSCIGNRFALMETKILFFYLLNSFEIVRTKKSCKSIVLTNKGINIMIKGGNWLGLRALRKGI